MGKIYTKTGDKGTTGTYLGRMSKRDQLAVALGSIDELNTWIGLCRSVVGGKKRDWLKVGLRFPLGKKNGSVKIEDEMRRIQTNLLSIGSGLAGSGVKMKEDEVVQLEELIDRLEKDLPKLRNFIYPTGTGAAAYLQVARAVARRAEREVVGYQLSGEGLANDGVNKNLLKYLNRLSDALFTMARWMNWKLGGKEEVWKG